MFGLGLLIGVAVGFVIGLSGAFAIVNEVGDIIDGKLSEERQRKARLQQLLTFTREWRGQSSATDGIRIYEN